MCGITSKQNSKGYGKATEYVEVRVQRNASYMDVATVSKSVVGLADEAIGVLSLFRSDGTVISDKNISPGSPWTIGGYLKSLKKSSSQIKLGVGYLMQVYIHHIGKIDQPLLNVSLLCIQQRKGARKQALSTAFGLSFAIQIVTLHALSETMKLPKPRRYE